MLNEQEKRLIKRYCIMPALASTFLTMALLIGGVWILLVMIGDLALHGSFYGIGLYVYLGIAAAYTIAFCICFLVPRIGMKKNKWKQIVEKAQVEMSNKDYSSKIAFALGTKAVGTLLDMTDNPKAEAAGDVFDAVSAISSVSTVVQMTNEIGRNAKAVAAVFGIKIPKAKKYIAAVVLLPIILLPAVYIPHFVQSKQNSDSEIAIASKSVYELQKALEKDCDNVYIDDPKEKYNSDGYKVSGYLYPSDSDNKSYVSVEVGNDGIISDIRYSVDVDISKSKEENLERAKLDILKLNVMINDSGVKAKSYNMLDECSIPEEFVTQFKEGSYYEKINIEKDGISINYMTDSQEEYDEYSSSYIYYVIKE